MPELPEVENVARALKKNLAGRRLTGMKVGFAGVLGQSARVTRSALLGKTVTGVHRHGKYLILWFADDDGAAAYLMIHLRMTGQLFILDGYLPDKHVHLTFDFEGLPVHYRDIRKFGRLTLVDDGIRPAAIAHVGPDMMKVRFSEWKRRIGGRLGRRGYPARAQVRSTRKRGTAERSPAGRLAARYPAGLTKRSMVNGPNAGSSL